MRVVALSKMDSSNETQLELLYHNLPTSVSLSLHLFIPSVCKFYCKIILDKIGIIITLNYVKWYVKISANNVNQFVNSLQLKKRFFLKLCVIFLKTGYCFNHEQGDDRGFTTDH